jgi:hypothetical protein
MRSMPTSSARSRVIRIAVALAIGLVATAVATYLPMYMVERGQGATVGTIHRGVHGWWHARDRVFGLRWSNLMLIDPPLSTPLWDGEIHGWEEPPPPPYPAAQFLRIGTLAAGWPLPALRMRWTVTSMTRSFPVPAELDDADTSIVYAAESALTGSRGGGPEQVEVLWFGAIFNVVVFAAVVVGPVALLRRVIRGDFRRSGRAAHSAGSIGSSTITSR